METGPLVNDSSGLRPGRLLVGVTLLNIGVCLYSIYAVGYILLAVQNPLVMLGSAVLLPVSVGGGLAGFRATFFRSGLGVKWMKGMCDFAMGLILFGVVTNVWAMLEGGDVDRHFLVWFCGISGGLFLYAGFCWLLYRRWGRQLEEWAGTRCVGARVRKGWWGLICLFVVAFAVGGVHGWAHGRKPAEVGENVSSVTWLPEAASDVSYYKSYFYTAYEFDISEEGFLEWAKEERYKVAEIMGDYVSVGRYNKPAEMREEDLSVENYVRISAKIRRGYYYDKRRGNGGGVTVAYDRDKGRAYFQSNPR